MSNVDFYFDFLSPYSYLATFRLERLVREFDANINYHIIDLEAAKSAIGNTRPASHVLPKKLRFLRADLSRWARRYGAPLIFPENLASFDRKASVRLNRGFLYARQRDAGDRYLDAAFGAIWARGGEPSDSILRSISAAAGLSAVELIEGADSAKIVDEYDRENRLAQERGVFGAPTFIAGDQIFWGNDRIDFLEEFLRDSSLAIRL